MEKRLWQQPDPMLATYLTAEYPWRILDELPTVLAKIGGALGSDYRQVGLQIWVHRTAQVATDSVLAGPCVIDEGAVVRPYAYIRGSVWVGRYAMVGHATEVKNSILMSHAACPHYNYVGDSILGAYTHLGAGAILSNLRLDNAPVVVQIGGMRYPTERRKLGALLGDFAQVGCNAVLNPGTVVAPHAIVPPLRSVKGYIE